MEVNALGGDVIVSEAARVIEPDIFVDNGVIHVIDSVIVPN